MNGSTTLRKLKMNNFFYILIDIIFVSFVLYAMFNLFELLDDIQKSPKWVAGYWKDTK